MDGENSRNSVTDVKLSSIATIANDTRPESATVQTPDAAINCNRGSAAVLAVGGCFATARCFVVAALLDPRSTLMTSAGLVLGALFGVLPRLLHTRTTEKLFSIFEIGAFSRAAHILFDSSSSSRAATVLCTCN
ncbi:unnamed protein product [Phytophthora fragariaefolia]|uniref:Unnamed protein product n=1 Tax=Phytophthora fragariaefolia TaxID=1490495 RepID=A0A9W6YMY5_9STRA|nr:unnamed protein product [Phytophthora fragariaefolia]